jgi:glycosyltransferase involved in cell wall biosynthesis
MTPLATVSVIVPTSNRCDLVRTTIERLLAQDYPAERLEIVIADSSDDGTPAVVNALGRESSVPIRLLSSDAQLPAVKRNHALRAAEGEIVIFLDEDVWVGPDFVSAHVAAHAQFAEPVAVLGHVEQSRRMPRAPFAQWYRPFAYHEIADRPGQPVSWQFHWTVNLSMPRRVMLNRNLTFHEDWTEIGHEGVELGYRWSQAGYQTIYVPAARGEQHHAPDLASSCERQASIGRGLRELEVLVPEPGLHERYGVLTPAAPRRARFGMTARLAVLNSVTAPPLERALQMLPRRSRLADWCYGMLIRRHTQLGYDTIPPHRPSGPVARQQHQPSHPVRSLTPV